MHASGDPIHFLVAPEATEEELEEVRVAYGLDKPLYVQYGMFLSRMITGDFGKSLGFAKPAGPLVLERLPATLKLTLAALSISLLLGIPAGIIAAVKRGTIIDNLVMIGSVFGQAFPEFWLGLLLILVFGVWLGWLPISGTGSGLISVKHVILPALTLSSWLMALVARLTRSGMLEVLRQDYIRTAYAKGLSRQIILTRHALRNALIPVISMTGLSLAYYTGGALIVEIVFGWPGVGQLVYTSILKRDYNVVLTVVTVVAIAFVLINLLVDIIIAYVDPRIKLRSKA